MNKEIIENVDIITEDKANKVRLAFLEIMPDVNKIEDDYNELIAVEPKNITPAIATRAGDILRKLVKLRTKTKSTHKEQKDYFKKNGRMVDKYKNIITENIEIGEAKLKFIKDYAENQRIAKEQKIKQDRLDELETLELAVYVKAGVSFDEYQLKFGNYVVTPLVENVTDEQYNSWKVGYITTIQNNVDSIVADKKKAKDAEDERLKLEAERNAELELLRVEKVKSDKLIADGEAKQKAKDDEIAGLKAKEAETKRAEQEAKDKLIADKKKESERLAGLGDEEKLQVFVDDIRYLIPLAPNLNSEAGKIKISALIKRLHDIVNEFEIKQEK